MITRRSESSALLRVGIVLVFAVGTGLGEGCGMVVSEAAAGLEPAYLRERRSFTWGMSPTRAFVRLAASAPSAMFALVSCLLFAGNLCEGRVLFRLPERCSGVVACFPDLRSGSATPPHTHAISSSPYDCTTIRAASPILHTRIRSALEAGRLRYFRA